jgi:hypothetical protein
MSCPTEEDWQHSLHADAALGAEALVHLDACFACRQIIAALVASDDAPSVDVATSGGGDGCARIGPYELEALAGQGAMGVVYRANDPSLRRSVALKLLRSLSPEADARLVAEAQAMARLSHPNVVTVYEIGCFEDRRYLAMEWISGVTLAEWLHDRPRARSEVLEMFCQAGRGLAAAHRVGVVHRDFKPDNVLIGEDGRARVGDFGLARSGPHSGAVGGDADQSVAGTPAYMAPEQLDGAPGDPRSDQFGFCVALWEALCRERPFPGEDLAAIRRAIEHGAERPTTARLSPRLVRILRRGLDPNPARRFATMDELVARLEHERRRSAWRGRVVVGVALAASIAMGATGAWRLPACRTWRGATRSSFAACLLEGPPRVTPPSDANMRPISLITETLVRSRYWRLRAEQELYRRPASREDTGRRYRLPVLEHGPYEAFIDTILVLCVARDGKLDPNQPRPRFLVERRLLADSTAGERTRLLGPFEASR